MNDKLQYRALTLGSIIFMGLSMLVFSIGIFMYFNLEKLSGALPVKTVNQFRNLANMMPLLSNLSSNLETIQIRNQNNNLSELRFTVNKIKTSQQLIDSDFKDGLPKDLKAVMNEISMLLSDLSQAVASGSFMSQTNAVLYRNRTDYIYSEFRDYILRINNDTLSVLENQERDVTRLKNMILLSALVDICSVVVILIFLQNQKKLIVQLDKSREVAVENSKAKSDFLSNMSHEIRTPMNAILGLSHLALKTGLTPRQRDYLKKIQGSGQHLLGIINDILDFSKIEAGRLSVERVEFDLEKVLDNVADLIAEKASAKGLELVFNVDHAVPNRLVGDPLRLGQILINYANNAVKFTEHGEIDIHIRVRQESEKEILLYFTVKDTGVGLTDEQKSRLFQSFQQADASTTRKYGGSGLGLVICKKLAELMGGSVGAESEFGKGSTFWFTAWLGSCAVNKRSFMPEPDLRGRRVLVVDDNDHARAVIMDLLQSMTFTATALASGPAAITEVKRAAFAGRPFDIVFLDWQMPGMDGIETARQIRALGQTPAPRMVMITAYGREEVLKLAEEVGIEDVLIKPVSASILFDTAMRVLGATRPERREAVEAPSRMVENLATIKGASILLVEDNELNQEVASEILRDAGFNIELAADGTQAVRKVREAAYDLVLMDLQMPVMDGLAATIEIRKLPQFASLPIVAMTANAMQEDRERCLAAGMNDHVAKPIEPDQLFAALLKWIKPRRKAEDAAASVSPAPATAGEAGIQAEIPGLDMASGLKRVQGKQSLYLSMLRKYAAGQKSAPAEIRAALDGNDWTTAERLAHTTKGVSGSIGAAEIQGLAAEVERAIREKKPRYELETLLLALETPLSAIVGALQAGLPPEKEKLAVVVDAEKLSLVCRELSDLLAGFDSEAGEVLDANADLLNSAFPEHFSEIDKSIKSFDFEAAQAALEAALEDFKRKERNG